MFNSIFGILKAKKKSKTEDSSDDIAGFIPAFDNIHDFKRPSQPPRLTHQPDPPHHLLPRPDWKLYVFRSAGKKPSHQCVREEFGSNGISLLWERIGAGELIFEK